MKIWAWATLCLLSFHARANCGDAISEPRKELLRIGLVQYPMSRPATLSTWEEKIESYFKQAHAKNVETLVFPELISIEGMSLVDPSGSTQEQAIRKVAQIFTPHFQNKFQLWSQQYKITVLTGSWPVLHSNGQVTNTLWVYGPDGTLLHTQSKNHLTHWEKDGYALSGTEGGAVPFTLPGGIPAAVAICFDSEFPNYLPAFHTPVPEIIFVPSMTEDDAGRFRVSRSASARAVEFHAYVAVTGTTAGDPNDPILGAHRGQAKLFGPSDKSFPADGVLGEGALNEDLISVHTLDLALLRSSRKASTTFPIKVLQGSQN